MKSLRATRGVQPASAIGARRITGGSDDQRAATPHPGRFHRQKHTRELATAATCALVLVACGPSNDEDAQLRNPADLAGGNFEAPVASIEPEKQERSGRGLVVKRIGQPFGIEDAFDNTLVTMVIHEIVPDLPCTNPMAQPPMQGHFIGLRMTVQTTPKYEPDDKALFGISPKDFEVVGPEGKTDQALDTAQADTCLQRAEQIPIGPLSPGSTYEGTVVLDSRYTNGILAYRVPSGDYGWEWPF